MLDRDLHERLRRLPAALAVPSSEERLGGVLRLGRRRRLLRRTLAAVGVLALLAGVVVAREAVLHRQAVIPAAPQPRYGGGVTAGALAHGRWSRLPAAPIGPRDTPAAAWTGRELLVWGGSSGPRGATLRADGAAYDPARRAWRPLAAAPLAARTQHSGVWTGRELLVWGGYDHLARNDLHVAGTGAAYDPAHDRWRRLPPAPLAARAGQAAVWTGREMLLVGGYPAVRTDQVRGYTDGAAYDPAHDRWRRIAPSPPLAGSLVAQHVVWAGDRLLVWSDWERVRRQGNQIETTSGGDAWSYDPEADRWATLPRTAGQPALGGAALVWTEQEVLSIGGRPYGGPAPLQGPGGRYAPTGNRWRGMATGPLDTAALPTALWTGSALLVWNGNSELSGPGGRGYRPGDGAAWDASRDRWVRLPPSPWGGLANNAAVWTGRAALFWGGETSPGGGPGIGLAFTPGQ
jgi:N-acetylneuraminic acid mutarotase